MDCYTYNLLRHQFKDSSKPCNHGNNDYAVHIMQLVRCRKIGHEFVQLYCACLKCGECTCKGDCNHIFIDYRVKSSCIHTFEILNDDKWDRTGYYHDCYNYQDHDYDGPSMKDCGYVSQFVFFKDLLLFKIRFSQFLLINFTNQYFVGTNMWIETWIVIGIGWSKYSMR